MDTVATVSGASSGMGQACARKLLKLGTHVAGFDVESPRVAYAAYKNYAADVRNESSVASAVAEVSSAFKWNEEGFPRAR